MDAAGGELDKMIERSGMYLSSQTLLADDG